jgi:hypothetical protein
MAATKKRPAKRARRVRPQPTVPPESEQIMLRTSERSSYKRCQQAWKWGWVDRMKPQVEAPALRFGTLIHAALEERYPKGKKRGPHPAKTFERLYEEELKEAQEEFGFWDGDGEWANALEIGVDMLNGYVDTYGRDEEWEVLHSELPFQVPVFVTCPRCDGKGKVQTSRSGWDHCQACGRSGKVYRYTYVGTIDGVWKNRMDGGVRLQDYKTCKNDAVKEARGKTLDEQATAYWTWGVDALIRMDILPERELRLLDGMLYTFLRKAKRDTRPQNAEGHYLNKDGSVSAKQPPANFHRELVYRSEAERERARARALAEVEEMEMKRRRLAVNPEDPSVYKSPHFINCPMCQFRDICELHEIGEDWQSMAKVTMRTWEPYSAHEIREGEHGDKAPATRGDD